MLVRGESKEVFDVMLKLGIVSLAITKMALTDNANATTRSCP